jgi:hypothetical protein
LVITTEADEEQDASDVLETVYPFSPLALLATNVNHQKLVLPEVEGCFCYTDRPCAASDDVLFSGLILGLEESIEV